MFPLVLSCSKINKCACCEFFETIDDVLENLFLYFVTGSNKYNPHVQYVCPGVALQEYEINTRTLSLVSVITHRTKLFPCAVAAPGLLFQ